MLFKWRVEILQAGLRRLTAFRCRLQGGKLPTSLFGLHTRCCDLEERERGSYCRTIHKPFHYQEWSISNYTCSLTRNIAYTVRRTSLFIAYSDERRWYYQFSHTTYTFIFKRLGECTFTHQLCCARCDFLWRDDDFFKLASSFNNFVGGISEG